MERVNMLDNRFITINGQSDKRIRQIKSILFSFDNNYASPNKRKKKYMIIL